MSYYGKEGDLMIKLMVYVVLFITVTSCSTQQNQGAGQTLATSGLDNFCSQLMNGGYAQAEDRCSKFKAYCQSMGADTYWGQPSCSTQAYGYCSQFDTGSASCTYSWWCGSPSNWYIANMGGCYDPYGGESFCLKMADGGTC